MNVEVGAGITHEGEALSRPKATSFTSYAKE